MKEEDKKQFEEIERGTEEIIPCTLLKKDIQQGKKLKVKFGVDPTAPQMHLGHSVVMEKLRVFQKYGHEIILIIGDFTAMIGDPSGRSSERPVLSKEEIKENMKNFKSQIFKILDKKNIRIVKNSSWLKKLGTGGLIKLASNYTVAQMLERNDFAQRYSAGNAISITEFLYPLLQGYDSFEVGADVEVGGTDQKFNLLVGREIQKNMGAPTQTILTMPLLEGTDGVKKMSKSYGNHIGIDEKAEDIFGKLMSISDDLMLKYYRLLTFEDTGKIKKMHPMKAKKLLARQIVGKYHGKDKAVDAEKEFEKVFSKGKTPDEIKEYKVTKEEKLVDIIKENSLSSSKNEAKRLIKQGAVELNNRKIKDINYNVKPGSGGVLKVGKRRFLKLL